jgi:hypothetical protein
MSQCNDISRRSLRGSLKSSMSSLSRPCLKIGTPSHAQANRAKGYAVLYSQRVRVLKLLGRRGPQSVIHPNGAQLVTQPLAKQDRSMQHRHRVGAS